MRSAKEVRFDQAMFGIYSTAKAKAGYNATLVLTERAPRELPVILG